VLLVFNMQPQRKTVAKLAVSCYGLTPTTNTQEELFNPELARQRSVYDALDRINDKYGEYVIMPALMLGLEDQIVDRIAFGSVKELEEAYW
jgi:DNA polymerase-4